MFFLQGNVGSNIQFRFLLPKIIYKRSLPLDSHKLLAYLPTAHTLSRKTNVQGEKVPIKKEYAESSLAESR